MLRSTASMVAPRLLNSSLILSTFRSGVPQRSIPSANPFTILSQFRAFGPSRLHKGWYPIRFSSSRPPVQRLHGNTRFRFNSNSSSPRPNPDPTPQLGSPNQSLSLTARLKALSRDYGWSALGVYIGLTILDFPLCFLAVRLLGTERIGHWEHVIIDAFWTVVRIPFPDLGRHERLATAAPADSNEKSVGETEEKATIWTELVLAYAVHKSLIFFRVPLTAALTPKVVKVLRGWGWNIGRLPKRKGAKATKA